MDITTIIAAIITATVSIIVAVITIVNSMYLHKSQKQFDLAITDMKQTHQTQIELMKSNLVRIEKNFSHKEKSLILVYETIAEIFYYLERFLVPLTTNDKIDKAKILDDVSAKFSDLRLISLQKELYIPPSAQLGKTMAELMGYINRMQNQPEQWMENVQILEEFKKELKQFQDRIKEDLKIDPSPKS